MPEIENDPITWKSFKSLPRLALMTWIIVFAVDAIFIAPNAYIKDFTKLIYIWSIGYTIAVVFEILRIYKKRENPSLREKGDHLFIPLNALLIFFYASAYNGFTKQVGSWSQASDILDEEKALKVKQDDASLFAAVEAWAVPILAEQTSYWPDVKVIAEKHELQKENSELKTSLGITSKKEVPDQSGKEKDKDPNSSGKKPGKKPGPKTNDCDALQTRIANLEAENEKCVNVVTAMRPQIVDLTSQRDLLLERIRIHNELQQRWIQQVNQAPSLQRCVNMFKEFFEPDYYDRLLGQPIDESLK